MKYNLGNLGNIYLDLDRGVIRYGDGSFSLDGYYIERQRLRLYFGYRESSLFLGVL